MENNINEEINKRKHFNALKWILVIGIVVVLNLFFNFAIKLAYDAPERTEFCQEKQVQPLVEDSKACVEIGGQWTEDRFARENIRAEKFAPDAPTGYCDRDFTCRKAYEDVRSVYNRNVFLLLTILGVASIVGGVFIAATSVSLGLSLGGVLSLVIGSMRYWSNMDDILRVVVLGVALVALIWLGMKKLKD